MSLTGKNLLILGATAYINNVVLTARRMGVRTIVVDPNPESPAKKNADKSYDIDTKDIDALALIVQEERIDGVMTAYSDVNLPVCRILCEKFDMPFYASQKNIDQTVDKVLFKTMCRKYGVPVVPEYTESDIDNIEYPVIVKPSDSYGSKGITVCRTREQLISGISKAKLTSPTGKIIIEKYMICDDVNLDYVMQDGNIVLSAVGDRYVNKDQQGLSPLSLAVIYPSVYTDEYIGSIDEKVKRMFREEGFDNGMVFIQSFKSEKGFYFFEMGYRPGGGQSSVLLKKINGIDYVEYLINYALTGKMADYSIESRNRLHYSDAACSLVVLLKQGKIKTIEGLDKIMTIPEVLNITQFYEPGDIVPPEAVGNLGQSFCRMHIVAESKSELKKTVDLIQRELKIIDVNGNDMLLSGLNTDLIS